MTLRIARRSYQNTTRNGQKVISSINSLQLLILLAIAGWMYQYHYSKAECETVLTIPASEQGHTAPQIPSQISSQVSPASLEDFHICDNSSKGWEPIFESLLGIIFREKGVLPEEGGVLDVGAQYGEQACHFALMAPQRQVIAMDPSPSQIQRIRDSAFAKKLPNLKLVQAGVGATQFTHVITAEDLKMKGGGGFTGVKVGDTFQIETVDNLFFEQGQKLAFAHLDVEGRELDTLKGATKTIQAGSPIFTTELRVHRDPAFTKELLDFIDSLGYDSYVVDEVCGWPHMDFRNLINVPREKSKHLVYSDAFTFALAAEMIWRVDSKTIFETVLPCCALGGECCQVDSTYNRNCCEGKVVQAWLDKHPVKRPAATVAWQASRGITMQRWNELKSRSDVLVTQ